MEALLSAGQSEDSPHSTSHYNISDSAMDEHGYSWYRTRLACEKAMSYRSAMLRQSHTPHCPTDYDILSVMCWPPTPAGYEARHPCTPDGFLNPHMFAFRTCLDDATWYVNTSFDRHPYTDFEACLTPWKLTEEEKLRRLAGDKIVRMLNSLDSHRRLYVSLYVIAIFLLALSVILCCIVMVKVKVTLYRKRSSRRKQSASSSTSIAPLPRPHAPHTLLVVAAVVLLVDNVVSIILSASGWPDYLVNCRAYKSIDVLSMLIFYQCMLGYIVLCVARILRYRLKSRTVRIIATLCTIITAVIVGLELVAEIIIFPTHYCGFGNMQGNFHWLFTGPKYMIIMCTICLAICTGFGSFCLDQYSLGSVRESNKTSSSSREMLRAEDGGEISEEDLRDKTEEMGKLGKFKRGGLFKKVKAKREEDVLTLYHLRQGSVSVLVTILFSILREVMVVLLHFITAKNEGIAHSVANAVAPHNLISHYARLYALATCLHGIVFAVAMCLCDVRVLVMLRHWVKSRCYGWLGQDDTASPSLSSSPTSHSACCFCFKKQHQHKDCNYFDRHNGLDGDDLDQSRSPGRDVITPILMYSTPSPQHSRCLPLKASTNSRGKSKPADDSPIALADNPTMAGTPRPALHPSIKASPIKSKPRSDHRQETHPDFPLQYRSSFTYAHVNR
ncbi:pdf receptor [Plakobranchus ocellatus]|uniref:Pdf receptor n=1 Tax=Plakobranchus ocellatus TaxID=259542 RepID=A0AAV4A9T4_9GAST|nr:pdf receptor [Plakobranchus ocellatus]